MNETQRKNLAKMGGREVSLTEFLDLKPGEEALIDIKSDLSDAVRELRERNSVTQAELAARLQSSQPRVAHLERGVGSIDLFLRALILMGATPVQIGAIMSGQGIQIAKPRTARATKASPKRAPGKVLQTA